MFLCVYLVYSIRYPTRSDTLETETSDHEKCLWDQFCFIQFDGTYTCVLGRCGSKLSFEKHLHGWNI